jgi:transcriptional regulator with PAS, ATPase and Fis domain
MKKDESRAAATLREVIGSYELNEIVEWAMRFWFRNPYGGLTVVDKNARVQFMDRATEKFFGLKQGAAKEVDVRELIPDSSLAVAAATGKPMIGRIWQLRGIKRISSSYPLVKNGEIIGAVGTIIFHSLEEIERINGEVQRLKKEIRYLKQKEKTEYSSRYTFSNILGVSALMKETIKTAKKIATLDTDVLIIGESGTGKELLAHSIHSLVHPERPFIKVNCPAIPFELAESELFGYEKGAFTGATAVGKAGVFEAAEGGTVFLDEISSLPLSIQAKLLRVLQEREVMRLGSTRTKKINFRSIAATNVDLQELVREGKFRHDLYYRVAKATIHVPALRDRTEDIPLYLNSFLATINQTFKTSIRGFSREALNILTRYDWPGNVRELINVLEQIAIKVWNDDEVGVEHLPEEMRLRAKGGMKKKVVPGNALNMRQQVSSVEKDMILYALKKTDGNRKKAAELLDMPRSTLYKKLAAYAIDETP